MDLPGEAAPEAFEHGSVFFVGTATTVIRYGGFTLLTDPNFLHAGDHVHLGYGLESERLTNPAIDIEALPPLDACVLSHLHGDHWDEVAEAKLRRDLPIVTTTHAAAELRRRGFGRTHGLGTWDAALLRKRGAVLRITSLPARHGPPVVHRALPPTMGSMLEWSAGERPRPRFRMWISGDTLVHRALAEIPQRWPHIPLALIHLGGTRVLGVLLTMDAQQGVRALRIVAPERAIPIHYDDYTVFRSSLEDFLAEASSAALSTAIHVLERGETFEFDVEADEPARGRRAQELRAPG
ncbi:MAG: MBL fold metallo-hydrolase [Proteobacteria bacterium]|nr:MAG: MBL fold metallo-hydrolase [Pseudomonadota bacterium]